MMMKDIPESTSETKLVKKKKKGSVDPKQSVVAFINEVNSAVSSERRAMVINNLYNMHSSVVNSKYVFFFISPRYCIAKLSILSLDSLNSMV
jgi:hypothetical protein